MTEFASIVAIRQPYAYDTAVASDDAAFESVNPTMTQQHFKDECDVNVIVDRFLKTGQMPDVDVRAQYGDFLNLPDSYQECLNSVILAQESFDALPARVRAKFANDPYELISWLHDPANHAEAVELGLMSKPPEVSPETSAEPAAKSAEPGPVTPT